MIPKYLFAAWAVVTQAAGNHLWQSSLFAVVAGLLTLVLRKHHARARYWLWLAASMKFLIPFSLLVGVGSHLPWARGSAGTKAGLYLAMEEVSQPFTRSEMPVVSHAALLKQTVVPSLSDLLPAILAALWLCGFVLVLFVWRIQWRRISRTILNGAPVREGREVDALRRLERLGRIRKPIQMFLTRSSLEPGIFGLANPVLLWPKGISERLDDAHLEAILKHELSHVRRRDNLTATIHMMVESVFWFHAMVWWLGTVLVEERERACDEEVLASGSEGRVYAESILKTCEFCVESPLACLSGVTGANLNQRILRIMTERAVHRLDFSRKLLLSVSGLVAVAVPIMFGLLHATQSRAGTQDQNAPATSPVFDVASIKPNKSGTNMVRLMYSPDGLSATNGTVQMLINAAYGVENNQISGGPSWLNSDKYDIEAKMDSSTADELRKLSEDERRVERQHMLQALLADRFTLTIHRESKGIPVYALVCSKDGPKFQEAKPGDTYANGVKGPDGHSGAGMMLMGNGTLTGQGVPLTNLVRLLTRELGRTVIDKTGLTSKYDFTLKWAEERQAPMFKGTEGSPPGTGSAPAPESSGPSIFTAVQEQLGLKLESEKGQVDALIIDHVEKPSEN